MEGAFRFLNEITTCVELELARNHSSQGAAADYCGSIIW